MTERKGGDDGSFIIIEEASLKMAESIMWNYSNAQLALRELVDNGVDNRIEGKKIAIDISITKDVIRISNKGGEGLDQEGLQDFLRWGHSSQKGKAGKIGKHGVGGKAAMGFLGKSIEVFCSPQDSHIAYSFEDIDWESKASGARREHLGKVLETPVVDGLFIVNIRNLNKHRVNTNELIQTLGETYRPLLNEGSVEIFINRTPVPPMEIKYLNSDDQPELKPDVLKIKTGFGVEIRLKVGVTEPEHTLTEPGFRLYYRGRLMKKGEFFGLPQSGKLTQASRLVGEVHLDNLDVTTNKSDFIQDLNYEDAIESVARILAQRGWAKKLEGLKIEKVTRVEDYERDLAKDTKRILEHILAQSSLMSLMTSGESGGRLPPTNPGSPEEYKGIRVIKDRKGATYPDIEARKGLTVKRKGVLYSWEPTPLGNPELRYQLIVENGQEHLKINTDHPTYQLQKRIGEQALQRYMYMTALGAVAYKECDGQDISTYENFINKFDKAMSEYLLSLPPQAHRKFPPKGSLNFRKSG